MTTNPTDIPSYAFGVELTNANYSGGAGGTFTDLVSGNEDWTVESATPSFSTVAGLEGMDFANSSTETVKRDLYEFREITFVAIGHPTLNSSQHMIGGTNAASNTFSMMFSALKAQAFKPSASSGYTAVHTTSIPIVTAVSWCPTNGTAYATTYDGTLRKASQAAGSFRDVVLTDFEIGIGRHRTTYLTGHVQKMHGFSRSLHYRDETALDDMILTLGAEVGL